MYPPPRKIIYFSLILSSLFLIFFSLNSCQEATAPEVIGNNSQFTIVKDTKTIQYKSYENEDLIKNIAYGMAKFLKSEHNRNVLIEELNKSNYVEKILEATEFLNKTQSIYVNKNITEKTILEGIAENITEKDAFIKKINKLGFGLIDIYFPLEEWRKELNGSDNLLIAAVGYRKNDDKSDVLAYDLNGNEVYLSATETPQIPTLVIYPSEKMGVYTNNKKVLGKVNNNNSITSNINYKVVKIIIHKDYDSGWFGGTMEIFFKHRSKYKYLPGTWSGWDETGTVNNVHEDKWKTCNKLLETNIHPLKFNIEVWEWDGWFNGDNDKVCDSFYDKVYDANGNDNYETHDIWNESGGMATRTLVDGTNIHSNYYDEIVVTNGIE